MRVSISIDLDVMIMTCCEYVITAKDSKISGVLIQLLHFLLGLLSIMSVCGNDHVEQGQTDRVVQNRSYDRCHQQNETINQRYLLLAKSTKNGML